MVVSARNAPPNVITLVRMCGKLFVVRRQGARVRVDPAPRRHREPPIASGVVVPFPARER